MSKEVFVHVTDDETLKAIERNGFGDPIPAGETADGMWVYERSLAQFKRFCLQQELGDAQQHQQVATPS